MLALDYPLLIYGDPSHMGALFNCTCRHDLFCETQGKSLCVYYTTPPSSLTALIHLPASAGSTVGALAAMPTPSCMS